LSPRPKREVFAIAFLPLFKIFRRLPIVAFTKEFLVGDILATPKEISNVSYRVTLDAEGLADIASHWKRGMRSSTAKKWLRDLFPDTVVSFRDGFCDHGSRILSRQGEKVTTEGTEDREEPGNEEPGNGTCGY
jgi:hypothetical protein